MWHEKFLMSIRGTRVVGGSHCIRRMWNTAHPCSSCSPCHCLTTQLWVPYNSNQNNQVQWGSEYQKSLVFRSWLLDHSSNGPLFKPWPDWLSFSLVFKPWLENQTISGHSSTDIPSMQLTWNLEFFYFFWISNLQKNRKFF